MTEALLESSGALFTSIFFIVGIVAGFIDAITGGGGMITIPTLLYAGLPPVQVLGTNKLQALLGSASASVSYAQHGKVEIREQLPLAAVAMLGAGAGALTASAVPGELLGAALPILLIAMALYIALRTDTGETDGRRRLPPRVFATTFVPLVGFYAGIFGPGSASFFMIGFTGLAGYGLLKSTAHARVLGLGTNLGALVVFVASGSVLWGVGLAMGAGQLVGAQLGSRFAVKHGAGVVKRILVVSSLAAALGLLCDPENALRLWIEG